MRGALAIAFLVGCGFSPTVTGDGAIGGDTASSFVPLHVPDGGREPGTGALDLDTAMIDTTMLSIGGQLPAGVTFDHWPQPGGPELAVLHVSTLTIHPGGIVRVVGARPLVVIASGMIDIEGKLDGSADLATPGPGGALPAVGMGAGGTGTFMPTYRDGGGGGGGYGAIGGAGGTATCVLGCTDAPGGGSGPSYNDATLTLLVGGSGGGGTMASGCGASTGGAGGGAIQLSTPAAIAVGGPGAIVVGGGGGDGGANGNCNWSSGGGGGSGGAIVLQAANVMLAGILAANGGGGGSGAGGAVGSGTHGNAGENGLATSQAALGGSDVGQYSSSGGNGGALSADAQPGATDTDTDGNGGGGGGSVGRIVIAGMFANTGTATPMPHVMP